METHRNFIDDSPSVIPNDPNFIENRHDQSIFSLLAKLEGISLLSHEENFPYQKIVSTERSDWSVLNYMPIQARRDKSRLRDRIYERSVSVIIKLINLRISRRFKLQ